MLPPKRNPYRQSLKNPAKPHKKSIPTELMPLNKYIAQCGICSRREAVTLIKTEKIKVNAHIITEPGYKITPNKDSIYYNGQKITIKETLIYVLLNKPKDHISTTFDPEGRKTVITLLQSQIPQKIYPVGRLDRNTTGVLLLTNDGDLAQKLTHPKYAVKKVYHATLDKPLQKKDMEALMKGIHLEDGLAKTDAVAWVDADKKHIGIEIHSGKNRIIRRMLEHLHYDVRSLDRVLFAGLTKKNIARGKWRFLDENEIRMLKYFNVS